MMKLVALTTALILSGTSASWAATVTINTKAGTAQETRDGVRTDTATRGIDLAGMTVTATYADKTSEVLTWAALDPFTFGGASSSDLNISMGFAGFDVTANKLLSSLAFTAGLANSVFDIDPAADGQPGDTPSSKEGFPLRFTAGMDLLDGIVSATYSNIVNLAGRPADGDLFTDLLVDFSQVSQGGLLGFANFDSDLDTLATANDLNPAMVPVPASLPLLLAGLGGLGLMRRRSRG